MKQCMRYKPIVAIHIHIVDAKQIMSVSLLVSISLLKKNYYKFYVLIVMVGCIEIEVLLTNMYGP